LCLIALAWIDFRAFSRSLPNEAEQELEATYAMCQEMASYQGTYCCATLSHFPRSLRGRWCEVMYLRWSEGGPPISEDLYLLWMGSLRKREDVPSLAWAGEEAIRVWAGHPRHPSNVHLIPVEMVA